MIDTEIVERELEQKKADYREMKQMLDQDEVVDEGMPFAYGLLGDAAHGIAICRFLLDRGSVGEWLHRGAEYQLTKIDIVDTYEDVIETSYQWDQPTHAMIAMHRSVLAGDQALVDESIIKTQEIDQQFIHEEAPERSHVLYYALALASYLDRDETAARDHLADLSDSDHGYTRFEGLAMALQALINDEEPLLHEGIETILRYHREEYKTNPETAVAFLSVDAMAYQHLADRVGLSVDRDRLPDDLRENIPESPLE